jgi:sulfoxide reductase heme-binding subunit YedZ
MRNRLHTAWHGMPWFDAAGHFSALKLAVLTLTCLPAYWMVTEFGSGRWDFPSPYVNLIYQSGLWSTYLLLASLSVSPLRRILAWGSLMQIRRMLGVASFMYAALHVLAWFGLRYWDWAAILAELSSRATLWIASISTAVLFALAFTSFDWAIRRMGGRRWKRLHRLVYVATFLAVLHFLMSPGSLQGVPFLMAGGYVWLMGWRLLEARRLGASVPALFGLGITSALFAFVLQPIWLVTFQAERNTQTPWAAIAGNFDGDVWTYLGVPPVWILLGWTVVTVSIALLRHRLTLPQTISQP